MFVRNEPQPGIGHAIVAEGDHDGNQRRTPPGWPVGSLSGGPAWGPASPPVARGPLVTDSPGRRVPVVRRADATDAGAAARLHAEQISEGFLALLGPGFLGHLYRRITRTDGSFLLVAADDSRVVGFVAGSDDVGSLYRSFVRHDGLRAGLGVAGPLIRNWRRVLETLRHGADDGVGRGRGTELLAIAVDATAQGSGVGGSLVDAFIDEVDRSGGRSAYVVVASDNRGAIRLYERAGFVTASEFELHAGARSLLLQWEGAGRDRVGT